jgi:hypothetical protein
MSLLDCEGRATDEVRGIRRLESPRGGNARRTGQDRSRPARRERQTR